MGLISDQGVQSIRLGQVGQSFKSELVLFSCCESFLLTERSRIGLCSVLDVSPPSVYKTDFATDHPPLAPMGGRHVRDLFFFGRPDGLKRLTVTLKERVPVALILASGNRAQ